MKRFPRKRVAITGAGSGIGRAMALEFARGGWRVASTDLNFGSAQKTLEMVKEAGGDGLATQVDVTEYGQVKELSEKLGREWEGLDIIINNAGVAAAGFMEEIPLEDWEWLLGVNLMGVIHGCKAFIPVFDRVGGGHIVNIASAAGIVSLYEMSIYNVSKAGVISLSETLHTELAPRNIGVSVVCPGFFKTDLLATMRVTHDRQTTMAVNAMEEATLTAEDIAREVYRGVERGRLYIIPMRDIKVLWLFKRFFPETFFKFMSRSYKTGRLDKRFNMPQDLCLSKVRPPK